MFDISPVIRTHFNALLVKKAIPEKCHNEYRKWLQYYLDFCQKYRLPHSNLDSLPHFIKKLQEKHQTQEQQKQASHSIALYYELVQSGTKKEIPTPQPLISQRLTEENKTVTLPLAPSHQGRGNVSASNQGKEDNVSAFRQEKKDTPLNPLLIEGKALYPAWESAYTGLYSEIKTRHYSPKTLKTYTLWIRQFQTFTRSKDLQLLSPSDVKEFLSFLAVYPPQRRIRHSLQP